MFDETEALIQLSSGSQAPLTGPFRLGVIATSGPYLVPHFLMPLKEAYPQLELMIEEGLTHQLVEALKLGRLDAVIAAEPVLEQSLTNAPLFFEPFLLAAQADHPLARQKNLSLNDLREYDLLLLEDGHCLRDHTLDICPARHEQKQFPYQATSLETLMHMVAGGLGCTVVPQLYQSSHPAIENLVTFRRFEQDTCGANDGAILA